MIDTHLLLTVAEVVREGSFERAAQRLHLTPSAVSQRVRLLEDRLGTALVLRGLPCTATEAGAKLCRHADMVGLLEDELRRQLPSTAPSASTAQTSLRLAVNADSLATWFLPALAELAQAGSAWLDVTVADQDQTAEGLRRGQVLAAVTSQAQAVPGCRSRRLGALRYVATASPRFMARWFGQGVNAESLSVAPSLVFNQDDRLQERWVKRLLRRSLPLPAHRLPSSDAFVRAALADMGWGMNPLPLVAPLLASGALMELLPDKPLDVPLYWQVVTLEVPVLDDLSACVQRHAAQQLS
ncbi:MAG: LysR family transcriptional regulator ArgP [Ideonella sp.]|nr:LysR family transcriptional regulator ArgP [Ideonella sp.]